MGLLNRANTQVQIQELTVLEVAANEAWKTRAYDLMETIILDQYSNSVNLKLYMKAFLDELDEIMFQTREVYLGRMLEFAEGRQLDIIGEILQQSRSILISLPGGGWFGFEGEPDALGMGNAKKEYAPGYTPGRFKSENFYPWEFVPLTDEEYRGVLLARGYVCNNKTRDINTTYNVIHLMLQRVPKHIRLIENSERNITLELESTWVTTKEVDLLMALKDWYIPMGVVYTINLI